MKFALSKKWFVIAAGFVASLVVFLLITSSDGRYRAESTILVSPYTNALAASAFEKQVMRTIPGVVRLKFSAPPTNANRRFGMIITVVAVASTPEDAQVAANAGALRLCQKVASDYAVTGHLVQPANNARGYSYFRDGLEPTLARIFKH